MSAGILDGVAKLLYVATIADPAAPTDAETDAGVDLTGFLRPGGDWSPIEGSTADAATADSRFNKTARGTFGGQPFSAMFIRDLVQGNDTAWTTLPTGTTGYFVVSIRGGSGTDNTLEVGDYVDVYAIDVYTRKEQPFTRNEVATFQCDAAVTDEPNIDVQIVSS